MSKRHIFIQSISLPIFPLQAKIWRSSIGDCRELMHAWPHIFIYMPISNPNKLNKLNIRPILRFKIIRICWRRQGLRWLVFSTTLYIYIF
jgi:hypothetical protein